MPADSSQIAAKAPDIPTSAPPSVIALFTAFAMMSVAGFGGGARAIVDQHHWISADAFNETYALCHFLPGPNIVNLSMVFGARLWALVLTLE